MSDTINESQAAVDEKRRELAEAIGYLAARWWLRKQNTSVSPTPPDVQTQGQSANSSHTDEAG